MLRGNLDVAILQPIFQHEARMTLADLYAGKIILFFWLFFVQECIEDCVDKRR